MEARINPSPVLNAPPAKESDPFFARRLLFCRYGLAGETHFKKESFRCILTLVAPVATLLPTEPSPSPNVRFRPATFPRELRSGLGCPQRTFRASDEQHPRRFAPWRPLAAVALVPFAGRPLSRVRRARAASRVALCDLFSKSHVIHLSPAPLLMAFRTTDTVFGHPNAANILEWPLCATSSRSRFGGRPP